jgi:hypothetical protein
MQALMLEERTLTARDHSRLSRLVRRESRGPFPPFTPLDAAHVRGSRARRDGHDVNGNHLKAFDNAELFGRLDQLQGNERDLRARLAARLASLGDPGKPISDPIYQSLFFALADVEAQRAGAQNEIARRVAFFVN